MSWITIKVRLCGKQLVGAIIIWSYLIFIKVALTGMDIRSLRSKCSTNRKYKMKVIGQFEIGFLLLCGFT